MDNDSESKTSTDSEKVKKVKKAEKVKKVKKGRCQVCSRKLNPLIFVIETCRCGLTVHIEGHRRRKCMEEHEKNGCTITREQRFDQDRLNDEKCAASSHARAWRVGMG